MVNNDTLKEVGDTIVSLKADKKLCFMLLDSGNVNVFWLSVLLLSVFIQ